MKADLRDRDSLAGIKPADLVAYLRSRGWTEAQARRREAWTTFVLDEVEIALPLRMDLRDYASRVADTLRTLEAVEERSQLQILTDLSLASIDIVRIRVLDPEASDGTLPLDRAMEVVTNAHNMVLAAACATAEPKLYYPSRKPVLATDYMRRVRMGQTERGSFIVTVLSRVAPDLIPVNEAQELGLPEPFERQVPVKLAVAIDAMTGAASKAIATGSLEDFENAVDKGVSANLCTAVAGLGTSEYGPRAVEIGMTWARSRSEPPAPRQNTRVTPEFAPVFEEAALLLKTKAPRDAFDVRGFVFRLKADPPGSHVGEITVSANVDGEQRSIWLDLKDNDYRLAAQAHHERKLFCATGTLKKEGRSYRLLYPHSMRIMNIEE